MPEIPGLSSLYSELRVLPDGGIHGSSDFFETEFLIGLIEQVRKKKLPLEVITSASCLRSRVKKLLFEANYQDGVRQSVKYNNLNGARFTEVPINGMLDGGGTQCFFSEFDKAQAYAKDKSLEVQSFAPELYGVSHREFILIDSNTDDFLKNAINQTRYLRDRSKTEQIKALATLIKELGEGSDVALSNRLYGTGLLGMFFSMKAAVCRHRTLLFHVLSKELGLPMAMRKGYVMDSAGHLEGHAWNEVLQKASWKIIDTSFVLGEVDDILDYKERPQYRVRRNKKLITLEEAGSYFA